MYNNADNSANYFISDEKKNTLSFEATERDKIKSSEV